MDDIFILQKLDKLNEHQTMLTRLLAHSMQGKRWRSNSVQWIRLDGTSTQTKTFDLRSLFGGVPAQGLTVIALNDAVVTLRVNGEPFTIPAVANGTIDNETVETLEVDITTAGTGDVLIRAFAYLGPGA